MRSCLIAREVVIALRPKRGASRKPEQAHVIIPWKWTRRDLLTYARACHPEETVRIVEWMSTQTPDDAWTTRLWLANPAGFADYVRAVPEKTEG